MAVSAGGRGDHLPLKGRVTYPCCFGRPRLGLSYTSACWEQYGTVIALGTVPPSQGPPSDHSCTHCSLCKHLDWHQLFSQEQWHHLAQSRLPCSSLSSVCSDRSLGDNTYKGEYIWTPWLQPRTLLPQKPGQECNPGPKMVSLCRVWPATILHRQENTSYLLKIANVGRGGQEA